MKMASRSTAPDGMMIASRRVNGPEAETEKEPLKLGHVRVKNGVDVWEFFYFSFFN